MTVINKAFVFLLTLLTAMMICSQNSTAIEDDTTVEIVCVNVGKADAIIVRVHEKSFLIDTGLKKSFSELMLALEQEKIDHLDGVFLTHVDKDHGGGLKKLAQSDIRIDAFYASPFFFERSVEENQIVSAAQMRGMDVNWLSTGDIVDINGECCFQVLGPVEMDYEDENNNSLVLMLSTPQGRALFAGDMEKEAEERLLDFWSDETDLSAQFLKAAHHGRDDATGEGFINAVLPQIAVISTDTVEEPRSASPEVIRRLEETGCIVYVTENYEHGVKVILKDGEAHVD